LWKVSLTTTAEAEEACTEALSAVLGVPGSAYTDFETKAVEVAAYLETKPTDLQQRMALIRSRLQAARSAGLDLGPARLVCRSVRRENWAESWKRHFKPLSIGGAMLLKPSWSRRQPRPGEAVIVLDPGLSFGTGHHATTSFCLREVVRFARRTKGAMLDMGCGSGILAIAAAKLGCRPVEGFDYDAEAIRVAEQNARRNRVGHRVRLYAADVTRLALRPARCHDLVCANLISNLLFAERRRIAARVSATGTLVLAGILTTEFPEVCRAFEALGFRRVRERTEKEWTSGAFVRRQ